MSLEECMARKAEQGALQYAASVTEVNPPRIGGAGFISGVFNDFLANPRLPFNRLTPIGRWLGYFWDSKVAPLALNFADGTNTLDSRITFSRSSNATVTDSNGNIVFAPHNLVTFSEQFDNAIWSKGNTTVSSNVAIAPNGTTTADKLVEDTTAGVNHQLTLASAAGLDRAIRRSISIYIKADGRSIVRIQDNAFSSNFTRGFFNLSTKTAYTTQSGNGVASDAVITDVGNGWFRCSYTSTPNTTSGGSSDITYAMCDTGENTAYTGNGVSGVFLWGAQLNVGSLQPYYPTTVKNLLGFSEAFENAAWTKSNSFIQTNLLTFSEQFDNAAWAKTSVTISPNVITAPNNTMTMDRFVPSSGTTSPSITESFTAVVNTSYTLSVYVKADSSNKFLMLQFDGDIWNSVSSSERPRIWFDPTNGQITATQRVTGSGVQDVGNGIYRVYLTAFCSTGAASNARIAMQSVSGSTSGYTGDGTSGIYIWGAQLVQGASAGDYVQTTSAALPVMYQAPNGTMTADKLVENTANAEHTIIGGLPTVNIPQTFSIYAKAAERTKIAIAGAGFTAQGLSAVFDLSNGTMIANVGNKGAIQNVGNGWYRCSITFNPSNTNAFIVSIVDPSNNGVYTGNGTSGVLIWGAQLSDSASLDPYVNTPVAAPSSTAYYGPRFDYDPVTRQPKGLLIEEARTNLVLYSEQFDNAAWTKLQASVSPNTSISPDGTQDADKLVEDNTNAAHHIQYGFTPLNATTYTFSVYLKAAERGFAFVGILNGSFATTFISVNLSTGAIATAIGTPTGSSSTNVGNGWWRVSISLTSSGTASGNVDVRTSTDGVWANRIYQGDGTSGILMWGAQLEAGAFPTSYIPTTTATVTRAADVAVIQGTNFSSWYKYDEGTLLVEESLYAKNTSGFPQMPAFNDGTTNNAISILHNGGVSQYNPYFLVRVAGVAQVDMPAAGFVNPPINTPIKYAAAYKINDFAFTYMGANLTTDTSGSIPTVDRFNLSGFSGTAPIYIRRINYYNRRLDNSQLQAITQ